MKAELPRRHAHDLIGNLLLPLLVGLLLALMFFGPIFAVKAARADTICAASWYGGKHHGRKTASGKRFDQNGLTAAHRSWKFGKRVRVTSVKTGRSVVVTITDRGPARWTGRCIDLSREAFSRIQKLGAGVTRVRLD